MPNTNGSQSLTKSMNGLIELEDGGGTVISDGIVTTNKVITNNIQGQSVSDTITLYSNTTGTLDLRTFRFGNNNSITTTLSNTLPVNLFTNQTDTGNIIIGNSLSRVWVSSFRFRDNLMTVEQPNSLVNLFTTQTLTGSITLGNSAIRVRVGGCIFQNNTLNLLTPSNIASLFTTQTGSIDIGNASISTNIGSFQLTNNAFNLIAPSNTASLFTTQTESIDIGNASIFINIGYFRFINNAFLHTIPSNVVSLFTNQTESIDIGNASISTNIGNFRFTNDVLTSTSTGLITLFPDNLGNLVIGNIYKLVQVSQFVFSNSTIFIPSTLGLIQLFVNHNENIILGNRFININIGTFNFSNKKITTTAPTELLTLFDTQTGGITMGNALGTLEMKASILTIKTPILNVSNNGGYFELTAESNLIWMDFHSNSSFFTDYDARISSTGGTASTGGGTLDLIAATTNITSPTTTITATTKVDITTPNLNVKANTGTGTNLNYLEVLTEGNDYVRLDFHSNSLYTTDFDSRIASTGGTATDSGGTLNLASGTINFNNATTVNSNTPKFNVIYGGNSLEMATGNNNALIDFHSNSSFSTDYDSRIIGYGGTALNGGGAIAIQTNDLNLVAPNFYMNNNLFRYVPPTTYTPTLSNGTCVNRWGSFSVTGGMMTVQINFNTLAGGTSGIAGPHLYGIPLGYTIKSVAYGGAPAGGQIIRSETSNSSTYSNVSGTNLGNGYIQSRTVNNATVSVVAFSNTTLALFVSASQTAGYYSYQYSSLSSGVFRYSTANMFVSFTATFPID